MRQQLDRSQLPELRQLQTFIEMARSELNELNSNISQTMLALQNILRIVGIKCEEIADGLDNTSGDVGVDSEVALELVEESEDE